MAKFGMGVSLDGDKALLKQLQKLKKGNEVKAVVKQNTAELQRKAQAMTGQVYEHPTGATKQAIGIEIGGGGLQGTVFMGKEYNPYTEYGTRFMRARPVLKPAFASQSIKFIKDLQNLVK